jgi:hypothetical protein
LKPEFEVSAVKARSLPLMSSTVVDARTGMGDDLHLVAEAAVLGGHHGEGPEAGAGDGQRVRPGVEAGDVQAAGAHRLDLGGVRLRPGRTDRLAGDFRHVVEEVLPGFGVDGRILDGRIGEDQDRRDRRAGPASVGMSAIMSPSASV